MLADWVQWGPICWCVNGPSLVRPHMVEGIKQFSEASFLRALIFNNAEPHSVPNSLTASPWLGGFQCMDFEKIQSIEFVVWLSQNLCYCCLKISLGSFWKQFLMNSSFCFSRILIEVFLTHRETPRRWQSLALLAHGNLIKEWGPRGG